MSNLAAGNSFWNGDAVRPRAATVSQGGCDRHACACPATRAPLRLRCDCSGHAASRYRRYAEPKANRPGSQRRSFLCRPCPSCSARHTVTDRRRARCGLSRGTSPPLPQLRPGATPPGTTPGFADSLTSKRGA
ncbi:hypothetical protein SETIT_7G235400v2 [Setaria italica]|uniref:Uncharacterized protein n=1 Tax=Setaria italica TaxID=4555 RepID=A0A368RYZ7_SETIT|nr:hypothetical protein SETIT_7G235400v2 [Setaria italica]